MENPIKMDDLGVPLFLETPICFCKTYSSLMDPMDIPVSWNIEFFLAPRIAILFFKSPNFHHPSTIPLLGGLSHLVSG